MKKKIITLCLVVALAATAIIGGTLAYFTDTKSVENTFTAGGVKIQLIEQERDVNGGLKDFTQNKTLMPIVGSAQGAKDKFGMPTAKNYADKIINVKNLADDAYVRVYIAVPSALLDDESSAENILHLNIGNKFDPNGNKTTETANVQHADYFDKWSNDVIVLENFKIGEVDYTAFGYTYLKPLSKDATTDYAAIIGCYLDNRVDYNNKTNKYTFKGQDIDFDMSNISIPVFAIGAQATGFDSADAALNAAFGENYNPWAE